MTTILVAVFGLLPAILLALGAFACLVGGLFTLLNEPADGALLVTWGLAGLYGTRTLFQVAFDSYHENTVIGLLAGITAAAPLVYFSLRMPSFPESLLPLYFTAGPVVVAAGYLAGMLLFEPADDARIIEYDEV